MVKKVLALAAAACAAPAAAWTLTSYSDKDCSTKIEEVGGAQGECVSYTSDGITLYIKVTSCSSSSGAQMKIWLTSGCSGTPFSDTKVGASGDCEKDGTESSKMSCSNPGSDATMRVGGAVTAAFTAVAAYLLF